MEQFSVTVLTPSGYVLSDIQYVVPICDLFPQ